MKICGYLKLSLGVSHDATAQKIAKGIETASGRVKKARTTGATIIRNINHVM